MGGSGVWGQSPQRGPGAAPWWGSKLELFLNQNCPESHQLTRMVVTHTREKKRGKKGEKKGGKKKGKKKRRKKVGTSEKVGIPTEVGKTASLINVIKTHYSTLFGTIYIKFIR